MKENAFTSNIDIEIKSFMAGECSIPVKLCLNQYIHILSRQMPCLLGFYRLL